MITAAKNPDGSIAVVIFNETQNPKQVNLKLGSKSAKLSLSAHALQTIVINNH